MIKLISSKVLPRPRALQKNLQAEEPTKPLKKKQAPPIQTPLHPKP